MDIVYQYLNREPDILEYVVNKDNIVIEVSHDTLKKMTKIYDISIKECYQYTLTFKIATEERKIYYVYLETKYDMKRVSYKISEMSKMINNCFKTLSHVVKNNLISVNFKEIVKEMRVSNNYKQICDDETNTLKKLILCKKFLSSQQWGPLLETFTKNKFCINNKKDSVSGDGTIGNNNVEIKISLGVNKDESMFNFVQIRPDHNIDYYIFLVYVLEEDELGKDYWFLVKSDELYNLLPKYGGYAHGTVQKQGKISEDNIYGRNCEYALRPKVGSELWNIFMKFNKSEEELVDIFKTLK